MPHAPVNELHRHRAKHLRRAMTRAEVRDAWLASRGYLVLRFTNEQVLSTLEGVLTVIRETAAVRIRNTPPSLSLPRRGGGNPQTTAVPRGYAMDRGSRRDHR